MKRFCISLALCAVAIAPVHAKISRSIAAKHEFMRLHPCPSHLTHSRWSCPGYVIDHVVPLDCGGPDEPGNMQWQTVIAARQKDKWERRDPECRHRIK